MSAVKIPRLTKLPSAAIEYFVGSAIVLVHLTLASRLDRQRRLALATRSSPDPASE